MVSGHTASLQGFHNASTVCRTRSVAGEQRIGSRLGDLLLRAKKQMCTSRTLKLKELGQRHL